MKHILILSIIFYLSSNTLVAQTAVASNAKEAVGHKIESSSEKANETVQVLGSVLYKGTLNGTTNISLYINEQEHPCGGNLTIINAMYKYDSQDKWILLDVTKDAQKKSYCMVEDNFTGVLFLKEKGDFLSGSWISPDTQKQFKVVLENQLLDTKFADDDTIVEQLNEILFDDLLYSKNDC